MDFQFNKWIYESALTLLESGFNWRLLLAVLLRVLDDKISNSKLRNKNSNSLVAGGHKQRGKWVKSVKENEAEAQVHANKVSVTCFHPYTFSLDNFMCLGIREHRLSAWKTLTSFVYTRSNKTCKGKACRRKLARQFYTWLAKQRLRTLCACFAWKRKSGL